MTSDEILDLKNSFKAFWIMTKEQYTQLCRFKDGNGVYLIKPTVDQPSLLLGYDVHLCKPEFNLPLDIYTSRHNGDRWVIYTPDGVQLETTFLELEG